MFNNFELDKSRYDKTTKYLRYCNLNKSKNHDMFLNIMGNIWDEIEIEDANDAIELFNSIYYNEKIDSSTINDIYSRCQGLKNSINLSQFKNQEPK